MIAVSACLCGVNCKYNGGNNLSSELLKRYSSDEIILVCPEEFGGLPTPRIPCEIIGGTGRDVLEGRAKVIDKSGEDVTANFINGAIKTLQIIEKNNITTAILKAKSPSCGCGEIYDGTFKGKIVGGNGITAELLISSGIKVLNEKNFK